MPAFSLSHQVTGVLGSTAMGKTFAALCAGFLALNSPALAWAQDDEDVIPNDERPVPKDEAPVPKDEQPADERGTTAPPPAVDAQASSAPLRRHGFFLEGDLGVYLSLGGNDVDVGSGDLSSNSVGNLQPMAALTAGYDLVHNERNNFSAGLRFSGTYSASAAQIPGDAESGATGEALFTFPSDVEFLQFGAALDYTYFLNERLGLKFHGDGGLALVSPNPDVALALGGGVSVSTPNPEDGAGARQVGGVFSGGFGIEYYTRLNGFAIGLNTAFYGVLNSESFIPGLGIYVPLKYTF